MDFDKTRLVLRQDVLASGYTDTELQRARRSRTLCSIRPGAYASAELVASLDSSAQHRLLTRATVDASHPDSVVSHVSAVVMHQLDLWNAPLDRVHLTVDSTSGGRIARRRHVHATPLDPSDVVRVDGVAVTSVARTVIDCARTLPFEVAVVIGDSALHKGLVTADELHAELARARCRTGTSKAARVVAFVDGRSESVGESRSRVAIHYARLPEPDLQRVVIGIDGCPIGRVDFYFEEFKTIGEFDGMGKYTLDGRDAHTSIRQEKEREDELRATGAAVARWTWAHLGTDTIERRIRYAFTLGRR